MNDPMRVDGELLAQVQAAFYKKENARMVFERVQQMGIEAQENWQRILSVVSNKFEVEIGKTHWVDIETGQLNPIQAPPAQPPANPDPPNPTKKKKGQK